MRPDLLSGLSEEQRAVVLHESGPLLVLAGPGSGKTRVITYRIAARIDVEKLSPQRALAVTFTNAAAREMGVRIAELVGYDTHVHVGTFHWMCGALLRRHIHTLGFRRDFKLLSPRESRRCMDQAWGAGTYLNEISRGRVAMAVSSVKNGASLSMAAARQGLAPEQLHAAIQQYDRYIHDRNLLDLDDIVRLTVRLLREQPGVRRRCAQAHDEIVVDEFQDVNPVQHELVHLLAPPGNTVVAVGDDDQAIYGWREALPGSLTAFCERFPGTAVLKLEKNFRSSKHIVRAANTLIAHNRQRFATTMTTGNPAGDRPLCMRTEDDVEEARWVAGMVQRSRERHGLPWSELAVLFRTNAQARVLEEVFMRQGIPYQVGARYRFYERPEIRHALAYLRLSLDPSDDEAAETLLQSLPGIGPKRFEQLRRRLDEKGGTPTRLLLEEVDADEVLPRIARQRLRGMAQQLRALVGARQSAIPSVVALAIAATRDDLQLQAGDDGDVDGDVLGELASVAQDVHRGRGTLRSLIERLDRALRADESDGGVQLLSLHAAKGREFHTVYLVGMEDGLLPHRRATREENGVEEERRLCFVGMTRAREQLVLSYARARMRAGQSEPAARSRFVDEIGHAGLRLETSVGRPTPGSKNPVGAPIGSRMMRTDRRDAVR